MNHIPAIRIHLEEQGITTRHHHQPHVLEATHKLTHVDYLIRHHGDTLTIAQIILDYKSPQEGFVRTTDEDTRITLDLKNPGSLDTLTQLLTHPYPKQP